MTDHLEQSHHEPVHTPHHTAKKPSSKILIFLVIAVVVLLLMNVYSWWQFRKLGATEKTEPLPDVDVLKIVPDCKECFSIDVVDTFIQQTGHATIHSTKKIMSTTDEAKTLIKKYKITKLPAVIVTGNIKKATLDKFDVRDDARVFDAPMPPYQDVATGQIHGKVAVTIVSDHNCKQCFDLKPLVTQLRQAGVFVTSQSVDYTSAEGTTLVQRYKLQKIPSLLLSKDALEYPVISTVWAQVGTKETDGMLVLRMINPPYKDATTGELKGLPSITYLTDKSCTKCYNVSFHKELFKTNFGMTFSDEHFVDVASLEGTRLINKYKIKQVPTSIISSEAQDYTGFTDVWKRVGDIAADGSFVFRNLNLLQGMTYKDLDKKTTVTVPASK